MVSGRLVASVMLAVLAGCEAQKTPELSSYRYRLSVEVQTPEGIRTASSVIEVKAYRQGPIPYEMVVLRARGEGPVVDLGSRGKLFVLLGSPNAYEWAETIMTEVAHEQLPIYRKKPKGWKPEPPKPVEIPRYLPPTAAARDTLTSGYPYMVRFQNPKDWGSMAFVDPDNLAEGFGKGVRLLRMTGEVTDAPVTTKMLEYMPRPYRRINEDDFAKLRKKQPVDRTKMMSTDYFRRGFKGG